MLCSARDRAHLRALIGLAFAVVALTGLLLSAGADAAAEDDALAFFEKRLPPRG